MHARYIVFEQTGNECWREVGVVTRRPSLTAKASRLKAIQDATGSLVSDKSYAVLPISEWRLAQE